MVDFLQRVHGNGFPENGHHVGRHSSHQHNNIGSSLSWLDLRVFFIRISKCEMDDSIPEYLTVRHVPLNQNTLLEVNGVRRSIYADGVSTLLRRDRIDKKSEEVTFVSTDTIRTTGSVKFEVFDKDILLLSGALELCNSNGFRGESENHGQRWSIDCESDILSRDGILNGKQNVNSESASPAIEVYVAGCFLGYPVILSKTLQLSHRRKQLRKGMLESIPEHEATKSRRSGPPGLIMQVADYEKHKTENESYENLYTGMEYLEGEDGELTWFNAGVRVGVGIGLSLCLGVGIGVGLLVKTYQGTTRNFRRRLF